MQDLVDAIESLESRELTQALWRGKIPPVNAEETERLLATFWRTDDGRTASERAQVYGIDLSSIDETLRLSPEERIDQNQAALDLAMALQTARS